jgi:LuxR family maltose regulon positive regulatory protein
MSIDEAAVRETSAGPPALLITKLYPPLPRDQTVDRGRLLEVLQPRAGVKLILVAAPAGCGKSTLLGSWRQAEARRRPIGWLTLDERDNDPVVLWSYVLESLRQVCPSIGPIAPPEVVGAPGLVDVTLPQLVNQLASQGETALVFDDFHRLSAGPARDSVAWLIEHGPPSFQTVLSSRTEPLLPLARLRARGELVEVRAKDLAFTADEANILMNGLLQLDLSYSEVDDLTGQTEGWAAGLYLAALSLRGSADRRELLRKFDGSNRHVVDFLVDEVLATHDPATQDLMLCSSILERFCGPLLDAVIDNKGSGTLLAALSRTNLLLLPLDDRGEWYRFHHLFARLLRMELEQRQPGVAPTLHRRAYVWFRDRGWLDDAVEHALGAGAFAEAGDLIAAAWAHYANSARNATVLTWLQRLPRQLVLENSNLLLVEAWVQTMSANRAEAAAAIAAVEERGGLGAGPLPDGFRSLEASLATLKGCMPGGDVSDGYENAVRASELVEPESPWRCNVCWAVGAGHFWRSQLEEADPWFEEAAALAPPNEQWIIGASSLAYSSLIAGELGQLEKQARLAEEAVALAEDHNVDEIDGEVHVALGMSLVAGGNFSEALPLLEHGVAVLRSWGQPTELANAQIYLASALRATGERRAAEEAIADARTTVDGCPDPAFLRDRVETLERSFVVRSGPGRDELSGRELAVLRLLRGSLSEREIGRELHLSHNTVHSHTRSIFRKLGVSTRADAVRRARELHLV